MTVTRLQLAQHARCAVYSPSGSPRWAQKPIPAAVVVNMPFALVMRILPQLEIYRKEKGDQP